MCRRKRQDELVDLFLEVRDERRMFQEEQMKVNESKNLCSYGKVGVFV